jgi:hypothetical protein
VDRRLLEAVVHRTERGQQFVADGGVLLVVDVRAEGLLHPVVGLALVLPVLDLVLALVVVDVLQREVDLLGGLVDVQHLGDDALVGADVVADVLDPAAGDLADVTETALVVVLQQVDEDAEVLDLVDASDDQFTGVGPAAVLHRVSTVSTTSPLNSAWPPVGTASV